MDFSAFSGSAKDPYSSARPEEARVIDTHLELNVDFNREVLKGKAILTIEREPLVNEIFLDDIELDIIGITNKLDGTRLYHNYVRDGKVLGTPFCVSLPPVNSTYKSRCEIQIEYETSPKSPALCWLKRVQTADGVHPFLLSYNKLIYARAWFPCQDTPSVKFTYTAEITVPKYFIVLMSALWQRTNLNRGHDGSELGKYEFQQKYPVPSYAVVIAVGSLLKQQLTEEMDIFAEREFLKPFGSFKVSVKTMLLEAKWLCGPYPWGRYDICVLPPSIAHFQIECPCVTFISPTLQLTGDRSSIISLAHNISQSWAGNSVTSSNCEHLWLNKSLSIFISRKIIGAVFSRDVKGLFINEGLQNLYNLVKKFEESISSGASENSSLLKCLLPNLTDTLPNEIENVPYEMGYMLLDRLEGLLGGPSVFEPFLQSYFKDFAHQSINTQRWLNYLHDKFSTKRELLDVSWKVWFHDIPSLASLPAVPGRTIWENDFFKLAERWAQWDGNLHSLVPEELYVKRLNYFEKKIFLNFLYSFHENFTKEKLETILYYYHFNANSSEVRFAWFLLCIKVGWNNFFSRALNFAIKFCSPHYASPIFRHLYEREGMRDIARQAYTDNKKKMLEETQKELQEIMNLEPS